MEVFAVVPIFTSAGAALLPTIIAAIASIAAIAFKPRELLGLCRRYPAAVGVTVGGVVLVVSVVSWLLASENPSRSAARAEQYNAIHYDWAKVAENIIAYEQVAKASEVTHKSDSQTASGSPLTDSASNNKLVPNVGSHTSSNPTKMQSASPLVLGRDYSRCFYGGGPSPVQLKRLWNFQPDGTMFISSPIVFGRCAFAAGCQSELGNYVGLLVCIDIETGKPIWQVTEVENNALLPFFSSPALTQDGKYLVIGQGLHSDSDCSLLCFEAETGKFHWAVKTSLHIESSPAIFGDTAVVGAGAIEGPDKKPVGDPGFVFAVRISDGKKLWQQPVNDPESSPAVDDSGVVYIGSGFNGNAVVALRGDSDEQLREKKLDRMIWRAPLDQPVTSAITIAGDLVITGAGNGDFVQSNKNAQGFVTALDRTTGKIRWKTPFGDAVLGVIASRDGVLICPSRTGEVVAISLSDGKVIWRSRVSGNAPVLGGCAFTDKCVYAVSNDGYLAVMDAKQGTVIEKIYLNDQAIPGSGLTLSSPQIVGARVFVGSETGGLHCLAGSGSAQ